MGIERIERIEVDRIERKQGVDVEGWMRNPKRLALWSAAATGTAVFWYDVVNQGIIPV